MKFSSGFVYRRPSEKFAGRWKSRRQLRKVLMNAAHSRADEDWWAPKYEMTSERIRHVTNVLAFLDTVSGKGIRVRGQGTWPSL